MPIPALVASGALSLGDKLLGGGRPSVDQQVASFNARVNDAANAGNWSAVGLVAAGGTVTGLPPWGTFSMADGKPERPAEIAYARQLLAQRQANLPLAPPAQAAPTMSVRSIITDAGREALRAAGGSVAQDVRVVTQVAGERAAQEIEQRTGAAVRYGGLTTVQWALVGLGLVVLVVSAVLLLRRK